MSVLTICPVPATTSLLFQLPLGFAPDAHPLCPPARSPKSSTPGPQETPVASPWITTRSSVHHAGVQRSGSHPQVFHHSGAQLTLMPGIKDSPRDVLELWTKSLRFQPQESKTSETRKQSILVIKTSHILSTFWSADGKLYHGRIPLS